MIDILAVATKHQPVITIRSYYHHHNYNTQGILPSPQLSHSGHITISNHYSYHHQDIHSKDDPTQKMKNKGVVQYFLFYSQLKLWPLDEC